MRDFGIKICPLTPLSTVARVHRRVGASFFIVNGLVALDSALFRSDAWWALYNGAVSYVLIAMLFAAEFARANVRTAKTRSFRRNALTDCSRVLPEAADDNRAFTVSDARRTHAPATLR